MKYIVGFCLLMVLAVGCAARPRAGMAMAEVRVVAKPKAGLAEGFKHVPVHDAAPAPGVPVGAFEHVDYSRLSDIIVWLQPKAPDATAKPTAVTLDIDPEHPSAVVHAASVGAVIRFHNRSSHPVSLYSVSDGNDFELPPTEPGGSAEYTVRSEGLIELLANPAKPPIAQLYAAPSPWVARTRSGRTVTFNDIPPGAYEAICWHSRLPGSSATITLSANQRERSTLTMGVNALPQDQSP